MGDTFQQDKEDIVQGFKSNDTVIMKRVYLHTYPKVRSYILKNSGGVDQAKDIFQEAFVACWSNIKADKFSENGNVEGYLFTIAKNKWMDYLRSASFTKHSQLPDTIELQKPTEGNEDIWRQKDKKVAKVIAVLNKMDSSCNDLLEAFYFERKTMEEIAQNMGIGTASARNKKYRCMQKLRELVLKLPQR